MKQLISTGCIIAFMCLSCKAQNVAFAQAIIDTLCSDYFAGRGYVNDGDQKAANFIKSEYERIGLRPLNEAGYFYNFSLNVNTFPETVNINQNGIALKAGHHYIVSPNAPATLKRGLVVTKITKSLLLNKKKFKSVCKFDWSNHVLLIDTITHTKVSKKRFDKLMKDYTNDIQIVTNTKLTWSVSRDQSSIVKIHVLPNVLHDNDVLDIEVQSQLIEGYKTKNVIGFIPGSEVPDSFIFVTGHYDHLGMMGQQCIMPGANDNASGIAMILNFATYYQEFPPRYSMVFIGFAAEEAGLVGSYFFVNDLDNYVQPSHIKFVVNMDLMGSGQEGIMAVNGSILPESYALLERINNDKEYLPQTKKRGKAANSDHYFFTESGIPAFFFYLMGPYNHYHDVDDTRENLRLEEKAYNGSFRLIRDFMNALMHSKN